MERHLALDDPVEDATSRTERTIACAVLITVVVVNIVTVVRASAAGERAGGLFHGSVASVGLCAGLVVWLLWRGRRARRSDLPTIRAGRGSHELDEFATRRRFAARIAHDINNPLGGIQNAFMLVKDAIPATHPHFKYVAAIEREIQRIVVITRQLYETDPPSQEVTPDTLVGTAVSPAATSRDQLHSVARENPS